MTFQRMINIKLDPDDLDAALKDPKMHYHALNMLQSAFLVESIFVTLRRMMLGESSHYEPDLHARNSHNSFRRLST